MLVIGGGCPGKRIKKRPAWGLYAGLSGLDDRGHREGLCLGADTAARHGRTVLQQCVERATHVLQLVSANCPIPARRVTAGPCILTRVKTKRRKLFTRPPRRRRWPLLIAFFAALAGGVSAAGWRIVSGSNSDTAFAAGLGARLEWQSPGQLPKWAADLADGMIEQSRSQYLVALADLNRDQQAELLIAPAVAKYDVFIPDTPLRLIWRSPEGWRLSSASLSCRPQRLGGFLSLGWWDLPCPTSRGQVLLRWTGEGYRGPSRDQTGRFSS